MKRRFFFSAIMMVAMMAASIGLTSCNKEDGGGTEEVQPKSLEGTWICTDEATKEVEMALTFDKGNTALVNMEGMWLFGNVERTATTMTLRGSQISMVSFQHFGNFTAKTMPLSVTVTFNYQQNGKTLVISNINATPALTIQFRQRYELTFDKIYEGACIII